MFIDVLIVWFNGLKMGMGEDSGFSWWCFYDWVYYVLCGLVNVCGWM